MLEDAIRTAEIGSWGLSNKKAKVKLDVPLSLDCHLKCWSWLLSFNEQRFAPLPAIPYWAAVAATACSPLGIAMNEVVSLPSSEFHKRISPS